MNKDWRCQRYGPLGWMEAAVKLLGIGVGIGSIAVYDNRSQVYHQTRIAQIVLMCIVGLAMIFQGVQRVFDRELFALGFIIAHLFGHWIMSIITILSVDPGEFLFTYVFLMILGEYIKLMFLFLADNIEVRFLTKPILYGISAGFIVVFIVILILQIIIWLVEY